MQVNPGPRRRACWVRYEARSVLTSFGPRADLTR